MMSATMHWKPPTLLLAAWFRRFSCKRLRRTSVILHFLCFFGGGVGETSPVCRTPRPTREAPTILLSSPERHTCLRRRGTNRQTWKEDYVLGRREEEIRR